MLNRLDYVGPAGIDFKLDRRDGHYKVIEVNCRIGISDCFLVGDGIDLAHMYYLDSQHLDVAPRRDYRAGATWCDLLRDFDWMREYPDRRPFGWPGWLRQAFRHDVYALASMSDPWPLARVLFGRCARKLRGHD